MALSSAADSGWRPTAEGSVHRESLDPLPPVTCRGRTYRQLAQISSSELVANASRRVRVRTIDASTARDVLDAGVDILVTDDPAIAAYAAQRDEFELLRLPWERTYMVVASEPAAPSVSEASRLTLAEFVAGAVRADVRVAQVPLFTEATDGCATSMATSLAAPGSTSTRVVYQTGDRIARGLAERLVALAGRHSSRGADSALGAVFPLLSRTGARATTAAALDPAAFSAALAAGAELAYVLRLPHGATCEDLATLLRAAPWLESANARLSVIPLVDTRSLALVRRGRVAFRVDADGTLRLLDGAPTRNAKP